ncbi:hypothetical protein D3C71_1548350 [compost metagenome]
MYRINADHSGTFLLQRLKARLAVVVRDVPAVFQRDHRVTAPQHHQLAVFNHVRPGGLLFVNLHGAHHVRHDHLRGAGGVVARVTEEAAGQVHQALQQRAAVMQHPDAFPAIRAGINGLRAMVFLQAGDLTTDQINRLVPTDAYPLVTTTQFGTAARAAFQPTFAHHRVFDTVFGVHLIGRHGDQFVRIRIVFDRLHADHFTVLDDGFEGAPVRAGQNAFLCLTQHDELR